MHRTPSFLGQSENVPVGLFVEDTVALDVHNPRGTVLAWTDGLNLYAPAVNEKIELALGILIDYFHIGSDQQFPDCAFAHRSEEIPLIVWCGTAGAEIQSIAPLTMMRTYILV